MLVYIVLLIVDCITIVITSVSLFKVIKSYKPCTEIVNATVNKTIDTCDVEAGIAKVYSIRYRYNDKVYKSKSKSTSVFVEKGEKMDIYVDPNNPEHNTLNRFHEIMARIIILVGCGIIMYLLILSLLSISKGIIK